MISPELLFPISLIIECQLTSIGLTNEREVYSLIRIAKILFLSVKLNNEIIIPIFTQSNFNLCMNSAVIEIRKKNCSKNHHSKDYMTIEFIHGLKLLSVHYYYVSYH